jgi:uncharacterized protein (DUF1015 family)
MVTIKPFRALRYDTTKPEVNDIAKVVCPPYDVIAPESQQRYLEQSQYNVVRLELGKTLPQDSDNENRYTRAAKILQDWRKSRVLVYENEAAFYLYEQEFKHFDQTLRRRDLIGVVQLAEPEEGVIIPHEEVIPHIVNDRHKLLESTKTNISPIFCLYDDPDHEVELAYGLEFAQRENLPLYQLTDEYGITHRLWKISSSKTLASLAKVISSKKLYIADGHHRYAAALSYRRQRLAEGATNDDPANFLLMSLTSLQDAGLVVLPIHRLINGVSEEQLAMLDEALPSYFGIEEFDIEGEEDPATFMAEIIARMNESPDRENRPNYVFGMYGSNLNSFTTLSLKSLDAARELMPPCSDAWQKLDVSILQTVVLEGCLNLTPESLVEAEHISYTRDAAEAIAKVRKGEAQRAFFLASTSVHDLTAVATAHDRMPAKSSFFYPKFSTGLVLRPLE